jgi:hypothetical protein
MNKSFQSQFYKDLSAMVRLAHQMDKSYGGSERNTDDYLEKLILLTQVFNQKYTHLHFKVVQRIDHLQLKLLLDAKTLLDAFKEATTLPGLVSASSSGFKHGKPMDMQSMQAEASKATHELYLLYLHNEIGPGSVYLRMHEREQKVELVFDAETIVNEPSFEFQLAAIYASKECDSSIKLENEALTFGFKDFMTNIERTKWHEKYFPRFTE